MTLNFGNCPSCRVSLDGLSQEDYGGEATDGDVCVCMECGAVLMLEKGKMREIPVEEINADTFPGLSGMVVAMRLVQIHNYVLRRNRKRGERVN